VTDVGIFMLPIIDSWQDLRRIAYEVRWFSGSNQLALYQPDETTIAMLDYNSSPLRRRTRALVSGQTAE
jgi:hypothetical protein